MQTPTALKKPAVSHTKDRPFGAKNKEGAICLRTYGGKHLFLTSNISSTKIKYSSLSWLHYNIKSRVICTCYFVRVRSKKHRVFWRSQLHRAIASPISPKWPIFPIPFFFLLPTWWVKRLHFVYAQICFAFKFSCHLLKQLIRTREFVLALITSFFQIQYRAYSLPQNMHHYQLAKIHDQLITQPWRG